jgi:hypothetical protein
VGGGRGFHDAVEVPGEGALEAAADVAMGLALQGATGFVGPGLGVASDAGDRDGVQCPVQGAVAAAVKAVTGALAAAGFQGRDSGQ